MDGRTDFVGDCVCRVILGDLLVEAVHQVKRTLIESLGCAAGASDGEPAAIARAIASRQRGNPPARVLSTRATTSADLAAITNTVFVHYLDCNDTYAAHGTRHPSDMI